MILFESLLELAPKYCLWCRGTGFLDSQGNNQCEQCRMTAKLIEKVCDESK